MAQADLVLMLEAADAVQGESTQDGLHREVPQGVVTVQVRTKTDVAAVRNSPPDHGGLHISALTGVGLPDLMAFIEARAAESLGGGEALVTRERHRLGLTQCREHLECLLQGSALPELAAEDLALAVRALGEVAGHVGVEEMLDRLFSGFCIGK